jgi:hypothetical protein
VSERAYRRAVRRAFATVPFYREQWARAGRVLAEPEPTPAGELPDPPHALCPFRRPWAPQREPSLWTPAPGALARALWLAGCRAGVPVLEVRHALLDRAGRGHRVLLGPDAVVASPARRRELNAAALAGAGPAWVVGHPGELDELDLPGGLRRVHRLPVAAAAGAAAGVPVVPVVLHDRALGYLGALVPACGELHLDRRVFARDRGGVVALSLPHARRPTLLDIVPPGGDAVRLGRCSRHGTPVLRPRAGSPPAGPVGA